MLYNKFKLKALWPLKLSTKRRTDAQRKGYRASSKLDLINWVLTRLRGRHWLLSILLNKCERKFRLEYLIHIFISILHSVNIIEKQCTCIEKQWKMYNNNIERRFSRSSSQRRDGPISSQRLAVSNNLTFIFIRQDVVSVICYDWRNVFVVIWHDVFRVFSCLLKVLVSLQRRRTVFSLTDSRLRWLLLLQTGVKIISFLPCIKFW